MERIISVKTIVLILFCSFMLVEAYSHYAEQPSPIGYWKTFDEHTQQPKSIVQLWKTEDNEIMGKVVKVYSENTLCTECTGEFKNKPITDITVVSGLRAKQKTWTNGKLLNTDNGKIYSCSMRSLNHGHRLQVRRYLGLPMLGKSQIWERVDLL